MRKEYDNDFANTNVESWKYYLRHFFIWKYKNCKIENVTNRILRNLKLDHMVFLNENIRHRIFGLGLVLSVRCQKSVHVHLFIWTNAKCRKFETRILQNLKSKIETRKSEMRKEYGNDFAYANIKIWKYYLRHVIIWKYKNCEIEKCHKLDLTESKMGPYGVS